MELSNNTDPDYDTEDNLNIKSFSLGNVLKKEIAPAKEDKAKVQNTSEFKNTCFHRLSRRKEKKGKKLKEMKEKEK